MCENNHSHFQQYFSALPGLLPSQVTNAQVIQPSQGIVAFFLK